MFVETTTGEAFSALGNLLCSLHSQGNVLIAARSAFFDYADLPVSGRLFDAIGVNQVGFARLSLARWGEKQFVEYRVRRPG